jgi:hypothetical protein
LSELLALDAGRTLDVLETPPPTGGASLVGGDGGAVVTGGVGVVGTLATGVVTPVSDTATLGTATLTLGTDTVTPGAETLTLGIDTLTAGVSSVERFGTDTLISGGSDADRPGTDTLINGCALCGDRLIVKAADDGRTAVLDRSAAWALLYPPTSSARPMSRSDALRVPAAPAERRTGIFRRRAWLLASGYARALER